MDIQERKMRILSKQFLSSKASLDEVASSLCAIQCQYITHALHTLSLRCDDMIDLDDRLIKTWTLRDSLQLHAKKDASLYLSAVHMDTSKMYFSRFFTESERMIYTDYIVEALEKGITNRQNIRSYLVFKGCDKKKSEIACSAWGGLIKNLCLQGNARFSSMQKKDFMLCDIPIHEQKKARKEVLIRYFKGYGPATIKDAAHFLGWSMKEMKLLCKELNLQEDVCHDLILYDTKEKYEISYRKDIFFLAGFDPIVMAYDKMDHPFLTMADHPNICSRQGYIYPALLYHDTIIGKWTRKNNRIIIVLFKQLSVQEKQSVEIAAKQQWKDHKIIWE